MNKRWWWREGFSKDVRSNLSWIRGKYPNYNDSKNTSKTE
jgi:hypothetical protein